MGNDGGGSIRIPAALCGVAGLKPQFGRVPSWPHAVHGWETMNHEGPMARTVSDAALLLNVMAGRDERDRFSLHADHGPVDESQIPRYFCDLAAALLSRI